jgi:hypothetical protein
VRKGKKFHLTPATVAFIATTGKPLAGSESAYVEALVRLEKAEPNPRLAKYVTEVQAELAKECSARGETNVDAALAARGRSRREKPV